MTSVGTYWRTLRHLRPQQIFSRIVLRLRRPKLDLRIAPPRRERPSSWARPARRKASLLNATTFHFLNERHDLDQIGWDQPSLAKLWRYNQHYFDDLNAQDSERRSNDHEVLIERWLAENPPTAGSGWEPYPISLRIVNWIKWSACGHHLSAAATHSLAVQARWLTERLETHLLGNHLFANAKALVFAGLYFGGDEAATWLDIGTSILERELDEQILGDGGQFERSPMYHALALEDALDLINLIDAFHVQMPPVHRLRAQLAAKIPTMLHWLLALTHPDGELAQFNDSAAGVAPGNVELLRLAADLGFTARPVAEDGVLLLPESGYVRVKRGHMLALLDVAPIGPDYLPGHAHADTLAFELSLAGRRVIVNGGTSCYGNGPRRQHERSTAAHSTVEVDGRDSSEVWDGFRVGRRARPTVPSIEHQGAAIAIGCSHDGYMHLSGRPRHTRQWRFEPGSLLITDDVGDARLAAVARFHVAPGIELVANEPDRWIVRNGEKTIAHVDVLRGRSHKQASSHAYEFGIVRPAQSLCVDLDDGTAITRWSWLD